MLQFRVLENELWHRSKIQGTDGPACPWLTLFPWGQVTSLSRVWLFATPWKVSCQAPPSMGFSRQEYWSGCHFLLQRIFPTRGSNPGLPHCRQMLYHLSPQGGKKWLFSWLSHIWKSNDFKKFGENIPGGNVLRTFYIALCFTYK